MTFLGDEGRDVIIVRDILMGHFTLLGPRASAADFFTGPIYYYMMAPFLFLANYNPVGPAIMIAFLGIATVFLVYRFGKEWVGLQAALIAAALYAVSPLVISYSRSSWNPNPMPFFSMIIFYLLYKWIQKPSVQKFAAIGVLYGIAFQLHYIEVFVGVIIFLFILLGNFILHKKDFIMRLIREYVSIGAGFLIGLSPFLAFEARHGFPNTKTVLSFIINGDPKAADTTHLTFIQTISDVFFRLFGRLVLIYPPPEKVPVSNPTVVFWWSLAIIALAVAATISILEIRDKLVKLLFVLWLFFGVVLFGFYHKPIYDYYFEFMFPLPFLLVGNLASFVSLKSKNFKYVVFAVVGAVVVANLWQNPFRSPANRQYLQAKTISEFVLSKTDGKPFNFALLTLGNSDHEYRYIFEVEGRPPVTIQYTGIDPTRKSVTDQLLVVCEDPNCQPLGASLWEVAGFGRAEIAGEWPVSVVKVYKLVPYKGK